MHLMIKSVYFARAKFAETSPRHCPRVARYLPLMSLIVLSRALRLSGFLQRVAICWVSRNVETEGPPAWQRTLHEVY